MVHDVITSAKSFPYTAKFLFISVRNKSAVERKIEYVFSVAVCKNNFLAKARKLSILPTSLDSFDNKATLYTYSLFMLTSVKMGVDACAESIRPGQPGRTVLG